MIKKISVILFLSIPFCYSYSIENQQESKQEVATKAIDEQKIQRMIDEWAARLQNASTKEEWIAVFQGIVRVLEPLEVPETKKKFVILQRIAENVYKYADLKSNKEAAAQSNQPLVAEKFGALADASLYVFLKKIEKILS